MKIVNLLKPWVLFFYFKQFLLLLKHRGRLSLGSYRFSYEKLVEIKIDASSKINLGKISHLCKGVNVEAHDKATISIGDYFFMNKNSSLIARYGITIGNNCMIGEHTTISDHNHKFESSNIDYGIQGYTGAQITIGNNVWIAGRVFIGQGVHIGDNVVIGANTIVTKSIPSNSVVYGKTELVIKKIND